MQKRSLKPNNIDEFISNYPDGVRNLLQKVRHTIQRAAPEAKEKISYGIPTFTLNGKNLIHFSAYASHVGLYPGAQAIVDFAKEIEPYETSKGTVRFPLDQPLPFELIEKITRYRVETNKK